MRVVDACSSAAGQGHPSIERTNSPSTHRPPYGGIEFQPPLCSFRVRRRQAISPHSNSTRSPVRQLRSLLPGAVATQWEPATHCADVLGTALATVLPIPSTSSAAGPSNGMGTTLGRGPNLDPIKTPACRTLGTPPCQVQGTVPSTRATMLPAGAVDAGVISARPRTTPRTTATPGAMLFSAPQCTFYSNHPLRTPDSGRRQRL